MSKMCPNCGCGSGRMTLKNDIYKCQNCGYAYYDREDNERETVITLKDAIHELEKLRTAFSAMKSSEKSESVLYLCDRKECEHCNPDCHFTKDISHARNFEKNLNGDYHESPRPIAFLEAQYRLERRDMRLIREIIDEQLPTGVVLLPSDIRPVIASTDGKEHPVKFCYGGVDLANGPDMSVTDEQTENFQQTFFRKQVNACDVCKHQHKMTCPNTGECYSLNNKPYFERKN